VATIKFLEAIGGIDLVKKEKVLNIKRFLFHGFYFNLMLKSIKTYRL
jgi:hypothetical protein